MKSIKSILILIGILFLFVSCAKKQVVKKEEPVPTKKQEQVQQAKDESAKPLSTENILKPEPVVSMPMLHKVKKGECLWIIASYKEIYNDPFMWPLIYKANKEKIKDPDLIFPGQLFSINRDYTGSEKASAVNFAKTRGKWSLFDGK